MRVWTALGRAVLLAAAIGSTAVSAQPADTDACAVPGYLLFGESPLDRVHAAVDKNKTLKIVVIGGASTTLPGSEGAKFAYPARLEAALKQRLPDVTVTVAAHTISRKTASESEDDFKKVVVDQKPDLVIWQTGTYDALRGTDPEDFRATVADGVENIHSAGADAVLVNMQYSPRTESIMALGAYADGIRWVARELSVPVFDRHAIMRYWYEAGRFDLYAATKDMKVAKEVHDCLGRALGDLIVDAARLEAREGNAPK